MTKDRLGDLLSAGNEEEYQQEQEHNDEQPVDNHNVIIYFERDNIMERFFNDVSELRETILNIRVSVKEVRKLHSAILSAPSNESSKNKLGDLNAEIKQKSNEVRSLLKKMQKNIDEEDEPRRMGAELRIRQTQHSTLSKLFVEVMTEYNKIQTDYREKCKATIQRQLQITGKTTTNEQLEEMLEQGNISVFTQDIIMDTQQAKQTLADIQARHEDIMNLEKSIRELHDMFMDMAMLIEGQGEMIDRIEYHVEHAKDHVQIATQDTKKATEYANKARKKKFLIIICLSICLLILFIWLITLFT